MNINQKKTRKRSPIFLYISSDDDLNFLLDISELTINNVFTEINFIFFINLHNYIHDKITICNNLHQDILELQYMLNKDIDSNEKILIQANIDKKLELMNKTKISIMAVKPIYQKFNKYILFQIVISLNVKLINGILTDKNKLLIAAIKKYIPVDEYNQLLAIEKEIDYSDIANDPESYKSYSYDEILFLHSKNVFPLG